MSKVLEELIYDEKKVCVLRLLKIGKLSNEEIAEGLQISIDVVNVISQNYKSMSCKK